jgi:hypothetical protein
MNRFEWDMNYPVAERMDGLILWNGFVRGPKAAPGEYFAKFKSGNDSSEVKFTIRGDPNYKTTQSEYELQVNFLLMARDKFSDIINALKNIKELRQQMTDLTARAGKSMPKEIKQKIDTIHKQLTVVEEALHQTKAKSGQDVLNYPIRLDDKLASLYNAAAAGNTPPSRQAKEAFAELEILINAELAKLKKVLEEDVVQLNKMIYEKQVPVIGIKKEEKE